MKKQNRKTNKQDQPSDILVRLDVIDGKLDELLRRIPPKPVPEKTEIIARNEPEYRPSSHQRSLSARSETELESLAFRPSTDAEPRVHMHPVKHPTLGSL